jgi:hypothetical protein
MVREEMLAEKVVKALELLFCLGWGFAQTVIERTHQALRVEEMDTGTITKNNDINMFLYF